MRQHLRRSLRVGLAGSLLIGLGASIAIASLPRKLSAPAVSGAEGIPPSKTLVLPSRPLITGEPVAIGELAAVAQFHVYLPNDPMAASDLINKVWAMPDGSMICIVYSTGLLIYESPESIGGTGAQGPGQGRQIGPGYGEKNDMPKNFDAYARRLAEQDAKDFGVDPASEMGTVKGAVSLQVIYVPHVNFGTVEFSYQGVRIALKGTYDGKILTRIAESME